MARCIDFSQGVGIVSLKGKRVPSVITKTDKRSLNRDGTNRGIGIARGFGIVPSIRTARGDGINRSDGDDRAIEMN